MDITVKQLKEKLDSYFTRLMKQEFADGHRLMAYEIHLGPSFDGEIVYKWTVSKATPSESLLATIYAKPEDLTTTTQFDNFEELWEIIK